MSFKEASEFTEEELQSWRDKIDKMTQYGCASLQRFAPSGHPIFRSDLPLWDYFQTHFQKLGGLTPEISKQLGRDG